MPAQPKETLEKILALLGFPATVEEQKLDDGILLDVKTEDAGRLIGCPVLLVLDRRPDVFLARRSGAEGWIVKPLDPIRLRRAATALLDGHTWHDTSFTPDPVAVPFQ